MILLLFIPALLWLLSCQMLMRAKGQRGLDIFFRQFLLMATAVIGGWFLMDVLEMESAGKIALILLALHTLSLTAYSSIALLSQRLRSQHA